MHVNDEARPTTPVSATELSATLTNEDVAQAGTLTITVLNPGGDVKSNAETIDVVG